MNAITVRVRLALVAHTDLVIVALELARVVLAFPAGITVVVIAALRAILATIRCVLATGRFARVVSAVIGFLTCSVHACFLARVAGRIALRRAYARDTLLSRRTIAVGTALRAILTAVRCVLAAGRLAGVVPAVIRFSTLPVHAFFARVAGGIALRRAYARHTLLSRRTTTVLGAIVAVLVAACLAPAVATVANTHSSDALIARSATAVGRACIAIFVAGRFTGAVSAVRRTRAIHAPLAGRASAVFCAIVAVFAGIANVVAAVLTIIRT